MAWLFNGGWKRGLGRNWSYFREQHHYERKTCKRRNFRWMTHLVLISIRGNDSLKGESVSHFSSSTADWNMNAKTAVHQESPGLQRDMVVLKLLHLRASEWRSCLLLVRPSNSFISNSALNNIVAVRFKGQWKAYKETKGGLFRGLGFGAFFVLVWGFCVFVHFGFFFSAETRRMATTHKEWKH